MNIPLNIPESVLSRGRLRQLPASPRLRHGALSRRRFMRGIAGTTGAVLGASVLGRSVAWADKGKKGGTPKPIPYGLQIGPVFFHLVGFGPNIAPGVIGDFDGSVGVARVQGTGTGTYADGSTETLLFDTDMRFMKGTFVGQDGLVHKGSFEFI